MVPAPKIRPLFRYTEKQMEQAIRAVTQEGMPKKTAATKFNVPRATLQDKVAGRTQIGRKMGKDPYLTEMHEQEIVDWIKRGNRRGLPPKKDDVLNTVQKLIRSSNPKMKTPFKDDRPGKTWFTCFMKRHLALSIRTPERVSKARVGITESSIREWFQELHSNITENGWSDILKDPSRIFNSDESNIQLCPKSGKVVGIRGWKNVYELGPASEKSTLTFLGTFSARGDIVQPMIIFPYLRVPADIVRSVPKEFMIGATESGWMKSETFYEFMANGFVPYLEEHKIKKPVILFVDGHKTHLTMQVSKFCEENGVVLYLLPPNTTHILQPADVSVFKPLKDYWRQEVHNFQRTNPNTVVRRSNVAGLLLKVLKKIKTSSIVNGFRVTGLFPLNQDNVNYSKCLDIDEEGEETEVVNNDPEKYSTAKEILIRELGYENFRKCMQGEEVDRNIIRAAFRKIAGHVGEAEDTERIIVLDGNEVVFDADASISDIFNTPSTSSNPGFFSDVIPNEIFEPDRQTILPFDTASASSELAVVSSEPAIVYSEPSFTIGTSQQLYVYSPLVGVSTQSGIVSESACTQYEPSIVSYDSAIVSSETAFVPSGSDIASKTVIVPSGSGNASSESAIVTSGSSIASSHADIVPSINSSEIALITSGSNMAFSDLGIALSIASSETAMTSTETATTSMASSETATTSMASFETVMTPSETGTKSTSSSETAIIPSGSAIVLPDPDIVSSRSAKTVLSQSVIASTEPNIVPLGEASSSKDNIFWEGKITYKKRKAPKDKLPSAVSTTKYRKYVLGKENAKKRKNNDWQCIYCKDFYSDDEKVGRSVKWINCDSCERKMHVECVSTVYIDKVQLDINDDECDFVCEACYKDVISD